MFGLVRHGRHQRNSGGARADDQHVLAGVIKIFRPVLRVDKGALVLVATRKFGGVAGIVAVVAGTADDEVTLYLGLFAVFGLYRQGPQRLGTVPVGIDHLVAKADMAANVVFIGGFVDVVTNQVAVGNDFRLGPRLEVVAKGEHVRVRANARVTKQIPGAADGVTAFQNHEGLVRAVLAQMHGSANAGQAGANDDHVYGIDGHTYTRQCQVQMS